MLLEMESRDGVLTALEEFSKKPSDAIPSILEEYLLRVSKTGETQFPWAKLKPLIREKLDAVIKKFNADMPYDAIASVPNAEVVCFEDLRRSILTAIDNFTGAPFTIQRLCELVTEPKRHYTRTDKFMRGLEKNVLVVTTVDPWGRKISSDKVARNLIINGIGPTSHACAPVKNSAADPSSDQLLGAVNPDMGAVPTILEDGNSEEKGTLCESSDTDVKNASMTESMPLPIAEATDSSYAAVKRSHAEVSTTLETIPSKLHCPSIYHHAAAGAEGAACGDGGTTALLTEVLHSESHSHSAGSEVLWNAATVSSPKNVVYPAADSVTACASLWPDSTNSCTSVSDDATGPEHSGINARVGITTACGDFNSQAAAGDFNSQSAAAGDFNSLAAAQDPELGAIGGDGPTAADVANSSGGIGDCEPDARTSATPPAAVADSS